MIDIKRLRCLAGAWDEWGLGGTLAEMADQIERELREERDRWDSELCEAQMDKSRVTAVYLEMNKHVLGHEGMEDSPVARWARELRGALKSDTSDGPEAQNPSCVDAAETADATSEAQKVTRDPAEDVSMSAYDLLPADEREAIAWVRERGGLDYVKREWRSRVSAVLAADGEPLEAGQTVWDADAETDTPLTVVEVSSDLVRCEYTWKDGKTYRPCYPPDQLTHTKPETPDSWDALWDDIEDCAVGYESFMRRCRALAERERGE